jgi:hypothetical protein
MKYRQILRSIRAAKSQPLSKRMVLNLYNNISMRKVLLSTLVLIWLLFVVVLYYAGHKPAGVEQLAAIGVAAWRILAVGGMTLLAGGLGASLVPAKEQHPLTRLALQAGLGFGLLALGTLVIGSTLGLPAWLPWAALVVLAALLHRPIWAWLKGWGGLVGLWRESGTFGRILAGLLALIFLATLGVALAPPVQFDSLTYHLVLPNAYLQDGRVGYLPWIAMSGMPQSAELLYAWAIALAGNPAATVLGWVFGLLAVLGLLGCLRRAWDAQAAWVGGAALLAGFTPAWLLATGYVDWLVFLEALGALVMLAAWRETGERRSLLLAGVFAGLAVGSKYTSAFLALAAVAALGWHAWKRRAQFIPTVFTFGLAALIVALPWFLKNALTTGNPFYPFFFTGGAMNAVRLQVYQHLGAWGDWTDLILLPLRATYMGFDAGDGYMFAPGMLLLGLGALAWLDRDPPAGTPHESQMMGTTCATPALRETAVVLGAAGLVLWAAGNQYSGNLIQTRYYFSIFPAFAVLAAAGEHGLRRLQLGPVRMARLGAALIVLALSFNMIETGLAGWRSGAPQAALGLKSQEAYLADTLGWFQPAMKTVRELPAGRRTQLIYEPRSLYCQPGCLPDELLDRWKRMWLEQGDDPTALRAAWKAQGVTHLLVYKEGMRFLLEAQDPHHPASDLAALERFLSSLPAPVDFGGVYGLYSLE